jgi:3-hydroxyisobutyrate dehydrogenase-like beta-hydroxyacid dehydrogenase
MSAHAVGFIGTGVIGTPMATRVLAAGRDLVVHDARPDAAESVIQAGATWASTPAEVAHQCPIVLLSLPGPAEVEEVVAGTDGVLAGARAGTVVVDLSTNSVATVRRLHQRCAADGVHYVDAPVSGGAVGAANGTLAIMASGDAEAIARAEPVLETFGRVAKLGASGSGTIVKLVNNQIFLCASVVVQEAAVLAAKAGFDGDELLEILKVSSAAPYVGYAPLVLGHRYDTGVFALALAEKDVALALESARALGVSMPVAAAAHQTYLRALTAGLGRADFVATMQVVEADAGITVEADAGITVEADAGLPRG